MPLILSNLLFVAGMSWQSLVQIIIVSWIFVVTRLVGALVSTTYKWGYFVFGMLHLPNFALCVSALERVLHLRYVLLFPV